MLCFVIKHRAGEHEMFSKSVFDSQIGKVISMNFRETDDGPVTASVGRARLVKADILENGKVAELTFESVGDGLNLDLEKLVKTPFSFKFK